MTHLVGIGGVGMSAIARVLIAQGVEVSGCDRADGPQLDALRSLGIPCAAPHDPAHLAGVTDVVASGAIADDEPELVAARAAGIVIRHRADLLADILARHRRSVVVTGAHGKTTTTSMLAYAGVRLNLDPTFIVGGDVRQLGTNGAAGAGSLCIAEGDESDRSVARLPTEIAVVLNADLDHLDHYSSVEEVVALLDGWTRTLPAEGLLVVGDGLELATPARVARFGLGAGEGLRALDPIVGPAGVTFTPSRGAGRVTLAVGGVHNASNACAAALVLEALGVELADGLAAIATFTGAGRRFERVGERDGVVVVDDYAHHPTELAATIAAARAWRPDRLVVYFQPHMPWRTRAFTAAFAEALAAADVVVLSETYVARGRPEPDASAARIAELLAARGVATTWAPTYEEATAALRAIVRPGDLVVCAGAGPVDVVARAVAADG